MKPPKKSKKGWLSIGLLLLGVLHLFNVPDGRVPAFINKVLSITITVSPETGIYISGMLPGFFFGMMATMWADIFFDWFYDRKRKRDRDD